MNITINKEEQKMILALLGEAGQRQTTENGLRVASAIATAYQQQLREEAERAIIKLKRLNESEGY